MSGDDVVLKRGGLKGRLLPLALAALVGLGVGGGAYLWRQQQSAVAAEAGRPLIGGPFSLVDAQGRPVAQSLLEGKWTAVFFGYTYCPDICPATLQTLQAASEQLGGRSRDLQVVLITVDPARDTPEALRAYLQSFRFPGGVHGLTGSPEQVEGAARAYRAYYRKQGEGSDYLMDHVTTVYLMDPKGRFDRPLSNGLDAAGMAAQIRAAMQG